MGHENGGWMNDDQRGEMREQASASLKQFQKTFDGWSERWHASQNQMELAIGVTEAKRLKDEESSLLRQVLAMLSIYDGKPHSAALLATCIKMAKTVCPDESRKAGV